MTTCNDCGDDPCTCLVKCAGCQKPLLYISVWPADERDRLCNDCAVATVTAMRIALADAITRQRGVVPMSADTLVTDEDLKSAFDRHREAVSESWRLRELIGD